jgi:hypothetical protein
VAFGREFYRVFNAQDDNLDYFEFSLANQITQEELMPYNLALKQLVDTIDARVTAGQDAADLQAQLQAAFAEINADLPAFFATVQAAVQQQTNDPNARVTIPSKQQLRQKFAQGLDAASDAVFASVERDQRDYGLNQEEYMAHFRLVQEILLNSGGARLASQQIQSMLTRLDVVQGVYETPVQNFMARNFPDHYVENMSLNGYILKHRKQSLQPNILERAVRPRAGSANLSPASFSFFN